MLRLSNTIFSPLRTGVVWSAPTPAAAPPVVDDDVAPPAVPEATPPLLAVPTEVVRLVVELT